MSTLQCRSASAAEGSPSINLLTPIERTMLLEFLLSRMQFEQRNAFMANHPRIYNVLYPGTLKVQISTIGSSDNESRVICEE
jgi:hypothetical protein